MRFEPLIEKLKNELKQIKEDNLNIISQAEISIILCRNLLSKLRKEISKDSFVDQQTEIEFFKVVKQVPLSNLVYYSELRSFETMLPKGTSKNKQEYIQSKIDKLNRFFIYNLDFVNYIEQSKTYLDEQFFTRAYFDKLNITNSNYYFRDPEFSTTHDLLLSKLYANKRLIAYFESRSRCVDSIRDNSRTIAVKPLRWTASKVALTELIYALYHNGTIDNGNASIKEIATSFQKFLDFDLGDFYKIYTEIRMRKKSRTKFLDDLSIGLLFKMDDADR